jgi:hypothetical protein
MMKIMLIYHDVLVKLFTHTIIVPKKKKKYKILLTEYYTFVKTIKYKYTNFVH